MLTVAIPTYNRNQTLNKNLRLLLSQMQEHHASCQLLLLDNCSPTPVAETLPEVLTDFPQIRYHLMRNKVNIGANANILRCFESCETEWIWCLSDDDPILPGALDVVLQHLATYSDCLYFNFSFDSSRSQTFVTTGREEFIQRLDNAANLPWISSSVHRTEAMQAVLKFGYQFAYTMLPHVASLLVTIGEQGRCCLSANQITGVDFTPRPVEQSWSIISFALGAPMMYDLPLPFATRQVLAQKLLVTNLGESITLRNIVIQLLLSYFRGNTYCERHDNRNMLYNFDQVVYRNYYLDGRLSRRLEVAYYRLMVRFPNFTAFALRA
ncbi:MAG: glycosyltransferase, partial [Hymenobacter sp.]